MTTAVPIAQTCPQENRQECIGKGKIVRSEALHDVAPVDKSVHPFMRGLDDDECLALSTKERTQLLAVSCRRPFDVVHIRDASLRPTRCRSHCGKLHAECGSVSEGLS